MANIETYTLDIPVVFAESIIDIMKCLPQWKETSETECWRKFREGIREDKRAAWALMKITAELMLIPNDRT